VSGPVAGDKLAIRLSAYDTNRDGYLSNPTINGRDNSRNQQGVRGQALFVPNDDFTLRVIAAYQAQNEVAGVYEYLNSLPQAGAGKSFLQRANQYTSANSLSPFSPNANPYSYQTSVTDYFNEKGHQDFLSAEANWDLHWATLTSITGYDHYYFVPNNDHDYTSLPIITAFGVADKNTHISQELRLASPSNQTVEWVSGLYYFNQRFYNFGYNLLGSASPYFYGALGAAPSATQQALNGFGWNSSSMTRTSSESVFGQATYHLDDRWSVTGGLRNTLEEKSFGYYQYIASNPNGLSTATAQSLLNTVFGSSNDSVRSNALSGTAGLSFKINDEATTYGSYSRGYKSAGLNVGNLTSSALAVGATSVLKPEKADAFELGLKTQTPDKRLVFNNALFETLLANYQTNESVLPAGGTTSSTFLGNVGFIRSRGIESELTYIPLPGLKLSASGSFTDAIYRSFHNAPCSPEASAVGQTVCDLTNQRVANTPKWTGNLSAEYSRTVIDGFQGYVAGQYAYRSGQFLTVDNSRYGYQGGYGVTNLRVGVRTDNGNYDLSFWVNNLFSSHYLLNVQDSASYQGAWGYPGDPLTLGTTLRLKF
jgi:iron complex outermembrane receptor protein